jgi:hypothetical protein
MLDPDVPPEVEGDTDGGAVAALLAEAVEVVNQTASAKPTAASTPLPWITVIVQIWAVLTMDRVVAAPDQGSVALISPLIRIRFPELLPRTWLPEFLPSLTTCSSWPKSRKPRAR